MAFQDFDHITRRRQEERKQKERKRIILSVVSVLVLLLVVAAVGVFYYRKYQAAQPDEPHSHSPPAPEGQKELSSAEKKIRMLCASTDYEQICEETLNEVRNTNVSQLPKDIVESSFAATSEEIAKAIGTVSGLKLDTPMKRAALDDCLVLLNDSVEELNMSTSTIQALDSSKASSTMPDLNNWLSAVMSNQETCIDGFPDGEEKTAIAKLLKRSKELSSNALSIVSQVLTVVSAYNALGIKRNLLGSDRERFPAWMGGEERRMLKADNSTFSPNATVAKDGSGNFTTISAALSAMPKKYTGRYVIYVKEGIYEETVVVNKTMVNVTMYGDGSQKTVVTGSKNYVDGVPTFRTATFAAIGEGFFALSIGFRNTAGPEKHQAVALRVQSDRSIFLNCRMEGYQDTLYAQTHRQFYRSCYIAGTVDFIFGDAAAFFQNCMINLRKPMENQKNIVTAHGRIDWRQTTGIVIQNSHILADPILEKEKKKFKNYLGRPWKEYSRTVVMETRIGNLISPEGWVEWSGNFGLKTLYYAEFNNAGPGAKTSGRVTWPGYRVLKKEEAARFTVGTFMQGEEWLTNVSVPVRFDLYN